MKILIDDQWKDGFLDYYQNDDELCLSVIANLSVGEVSDQYFVRKRSLRLILNYIREIGIYNVIRKVISRSNESIRNKKYVSIGVGRVVGSETDGNHVVYIATSHPACADRICVPKVFTRQIDIAEFEFPAKKLVYSQDYDSGELDIVRRYAGWNYYSGAAVPDDVEVALDNATASLKSYDWSSCPSTTTEADRPQQCLVGEITPTNKLSAILFGYGNYAKTVVLPNISRMVDLRAVNEVDALQLPIDRDPAIRWSTIPHLSDMDRADLVLIAGYHHTHAGLAVEALNRGMHAVVEKPVVTDRQQLALLSDALKASDASFFACFHKRYLPLNDLALEDLGFERGEQPISYHCIVYEVPLPSLHWYRWPNSKSRLVSNGCHWLDHFLWLNDFSRPVFMDLQVSGNAVINCTVELENSAFFTMVLTDEGSERIGVQDYIELRHENVTIYMKNGADYYSENSEKIIRSTKINKMDSYKSMYRSIAQAIYSGSEGDSLLSIQVSSDLVLRLEELFQSKI